MQNYYIVMSTDIESVYVALELELYGTCDSEVISYLSE